MPCSKRERVRCAFTLIELLVVIAIIGILAAMLLPALARSKAQARKIHCISKQAQWAKGLMMYAADNEEEMPRESFLDNGTTLNQWAQVYNALAVDVWYNALPPAVESQSAKYYAPSILRPDFYDRSLMFHCPEAKFPKNAASKPDTYFSIAMNSKLILIPKRTLKLSVIERPSDTIIFLDNRLDGEKKIHPAQPDDNLGQPSAYASRFVARHLGRGVLAFADGHVQWHRGSEVVSNGFAIYPQRTIIWTANPQVNPDTTN
jgi:prepilin-type N-terminal cleavage/methylation domain-containing protein/prepilin-type processing-associated H-X9-DG protein